MNAGDGRQTPVQVALAEKKAQRCADGGEGIIKLVDVSSFGERSCYVADVSSFGFDFRLLVYKCLAAC